MYLSLVPWDVGVRVRVVPTSELREEVSESRDAPVLGDVATDLGAEVQLIDALEPLIGGREVLPKSVIRALSQLQSPFL